jgi:hypothetical protein
VSLFSSTIESLHIVLIDAAQLAEISIIGAIIFAYLNSFHYIPKNTSNPKQHRCSYYGCNSIMIVKGNLASLFN